MGGGGPGMGYSRGALQDGFVHDVDVCGWMGRDGRMLLVFVFMLLLFIGGRCEMCEMKR